LITATLRFAWRRVQFIAVTRFLLTAELVFDIVHYTHAQCLLRRVLKLWTGGHISRCSLSSKFLT